MYERGGAQDDGWILWIVTNSRDLTGYMLIGNMRTAFAHFQLASNWLHRPPPSLQTPADNTPTSR